MKNLTTEQVEHLLIKFIKLGLLFVLFLPLVMHSHFFFPFIVVKNTLFRITVEAIFLAYLILMHLNHRYRPQLDKITIGLVLFFITSVIAGIAGIGWYSSFWGNYERMSGIFHSLHLLLYFLVLVNVFKEKKDWHSFLTFSIFVSLLMSFLGLAQWLKIPFLLQSSGGERLSGTVGNATFFAAYLIFNLFFALYLLAKEKRFDLKLFTFSFLVSDLFLVLSGILFKIFGTADWNRLNFLKIPILNQALEYSGLFYPFLIFQLLIIATWFLREKKHVVRILLFVIFGFEFFIFFNTQTRGAIVGFFFSIVFLALASLFLGKINIKIKSFSLAFLILAIIIPFALLAAKNTTFVINNGTLSRLATISLTDITTESRLLTWQASWRGWSESIKSFIIGYGPENYYYAFNKYFPAPIYKDVGSQIWFDRAHNIIFDIGVTTGILGLLIYLSILGVAVFYLFKNYKQTSSVSSSWLLIALIIAYFLQDFFVFDTINTEIPFYLFLGFVAFIGFKESSPVSEENQDSSRKEVNYIYILILVIIFALVTVAVNVRAIRANNYIYKALISPELAQNGTNQKLEFFKKSINEAIVGKFEARQQLANYAADLSKSGKTPTASIKSIIDYATEELNKSVEEEPLNVRHHMWLANFYNGTTRFNQTNPDKAIDLLEKAIELSPTRPQVYWEMAQAYTFKLDFENAEKYFKKGAEISPNVIDSYWNLLSIYVVFDKQDLADAEWQLMQTQLNWTPKLADYKKLVDLYGRVKKYDKTIEFQGKVIELEPTATNYAVLAAMYSKVGNIEKAKEATQKAVELDPTFAAEAERFLEMLESGEL